MADYTPITDFASKDSLPSGNVNKLVRGTEIDAEFDAIATAVATKLDNDAVNIINVNSTSPALTITQTGTGAALVVEDSTSPDSTPFVVSAAGDVGIGTSSPANKLTVSGNANVTGNVTLGTATTDTVTVNGYMGVGGAGSSNIAIRVQSNALTGTNQYGVASTPTSTSSATGSIRSIYSAPATAALAFTVADVAGFWAANATKGAGSTITNQHGVYIVDQTQGTNNYGITSLVSSGTDKWNIYASGTAANYFAGQTLFRSSSAPAIATAADLGVSSIGSVSNSSWRGLAMETADLGASTGNVGVYLSAPYASGTVNQAFFRVKRGAGSVYNGAEIAFNGAFRFLGSLTEDTSERLRIDSAGNQFLYQPAPAAVNATATLTVANLQTRIITSTTAAAVTGTLPTGTLMDGWFSGATDMAVDWTVINTGATNNFTVALGTGHSVVGNMVVLPSASGAFRSRRTAANTWITYRVS